MTRFLEVTGNSGAKAAVNVDHIVDFWPMSDAFRAYLGGVASNCHAGLSTSRCGESDEGVWHVRETYDEIKALLLAGGAVITEPPPRDWRASAAAGGPGGKVTEKATP